MICINLLGPVSATFQINDATVKLGGVSSDSLAIVVQEIPPNQGMEFGTILPVPTPREAEEWLGAKVI